MFYTKYRPQKFSEISRPNEAADALVTQVLAGKTVHAYLFMGPRGTGKTSTARILAKALNCKKLLKNGDPCAKCASCEGIRTGNYPDLIEIDAASNRGIDDIRQLKEKVRLAPSSGMCKIYIIDEVHMLTAEAFNALLKTLEEPPKNTVFILCTTEVHKVPDTIKSRCQVFKFKRASVEQIAEKLARIAKEEGYKLTETDAKRIAKSSLGGFRDAETLLQQVIESGMDVLGFSKMITSDSYGVFTELLETNDVRGSLEYITKLFNEGVDLYVWMGELIKYLRELLLLESGCSKDILEIHLSIDRSNIELTGTNKITWLSKVLERLNRAHVEIRSSYIPQLPIELAIIDLLTHYTDGQNTPTEPQNDPIEPTVHKPTSPSKKDIKSVEGSHISKNKVDKEDTKSETTVNIQVGAIADKWSEVVDKVKAINSSILALLKSGTISKVEGKFLVLEVSYAFHKERIESPRNRSVLEKVLEETFGQPLSIKCEVAKSKRTDVGHGESGVLSDYNVVPAAIENYDRDKVLAMFDGGLPL